MKRLIYIILFIFSITLSSCSTTLYTPYDYYDDTSYITYYNEYYYNGAYRPVIYRNSVYYYYYLPWRINYGN